MYKCYTEWYCDICGKKIDGYRCHVGFNELIESVEQSENASYDICEDCARAFNEWKNERHAIETCGIMRGDDEV